MVKLEDKAVGSVPLSIYKYYFATGGYGYLTIALIIFVVA